MARVDFSSAGSAPHSGSVPHYLALSTTAATLVLILAGGLVTSLGAGLAVPDWPTTFGYNMFLFPWAKMVGGIFYEHVHRLLGSLVGLLTVLTSAIIWWREPRKWICWLGTAGVGLVIVQGVLGGLRVVWLKLTLAIVHACVAQLFFALMVSLAVFTSRGWAETSGPSYEEDEPGLRRLSLLTAALIYVQTIFGAVLRHTGQRLDAHLLFAALAAILVFLLAKKILGRASDPAGLRVPAHGLWILLILQLALGAASFVVNYTAADDAAGPWTIALLTSGHVLTGALLFAASIVLALRIRRGDFPARIGLRNFSLPEPPPAS